MLVSYNRGLPQSPKSPAINIANKENVENQVQTPPFSSFAGNVKPIDEIARSSTERYVTGVLY